MKCAHCGAELKGKDLCSECGKKTERAPELEVEYKDFKVSEYLEIRKKERKPSMGSEAGAQENKQQAVPSRVSRRMSERPSENTRGKTPAEGDQVREMPAPGSPKGKRASSFTVAIILLLLAALAGALYVWRFLVR